MKFDLLIKDCLVVDPKNGRKAVASLGIRERRIADVADDLPAEEARAI